MFVEERPICSNPISTLSFDVQVVRVQTVAEDSCGTFLRVEDEDPAWLPPRYQKQSLKASTACFRKKNEGQDT